MLGYYPARWLFKRKPQPTTWNTILRKRDPMGTVIIYRSTETKSGTVLHSSTRQLVNQIVQPSDLETFGIDEDPEYMKPGENEKELLVVVKRGPGADILQHDPRFQGTDLEQWTWPKITKGTTHRPLENTLYEHNFSCWEIRLDTYNDVDDYIWLEDPDEVD